MGAREDLDAQAKAHGFADAAELIRMSNTLDYGRPGLLFAYEIWKQHDGTKAGLLKLIESSKKKL